MTYIKGAIMKQWPKDVPDGVVKLAGPIRGYKAFNNDWTCRGKQYSCPGTFKEYVVPKPCECGMHFCPRLEDIYEYYEFEPDTRVAEVIAHGDIYKESSADDIPDKLVTNHLEIVRELSWDEVNKLMNVGSGNIGRCNTGSCNIDSFNTGFGNHGKRNTGMCNIGNFNAGDQNIGSKNSGHRNSGDHNTGNDNLGDYNSGNTNRGNFNIGDYNLGNYNVGVFNYNSVFGNSRRIMLFNKPSEWTLNDWYCSEACMLLATMPKIARKGVFVYKVDIDRLAKSDSTKRLANKARHALLDYHSTEDNEGMVVYDDAAKEQQRQEWWKNLSPDQRLCIIKLPNFDKDIFKSITGIDIYDVDPIDFNYDDTRIEKVCEGDA